MMDFFLPGKEAVQAIMKEVGNRTLIDVGAGSGKFELMARGLGYKNIMSIDLYPKGVHVFQFNALDFEFGTRMVPMFLRPCHGGFVESVIRLVKYDVPFFIYVSMPENVEQDIGDVDYINILPDWEGEDGEVILKVECMSQNDTERFFLLENTNFPTMGRWFARKEDDFYINLQGGRQPVGKPLKVIGEYFVREEDLDYSKTYLCKLDSDTGWLSPDGEWHPCAKKDHCTYAVLVLKKDPSELEDEGWVHVYGSYAKLGRDSFSYTQELTQQQRLWLVNEGHRPGIKKEQLLKNNGFLNLSKIQKKL